MEAVLRPLSPAQILDRTFHIYRSHFFVLAGIGILLPVLLLIHTLVFIFLGFPPHSRAAMQGFPYWSRLIEYLFTWALVYMIGQTVVGGATVYAISKFYLEEAVTIAKCYRATLKRIGGLLRIAISIYLRITGAFLVAYVAVVLVFVGLSDTFEMAANSANKLVIGVIILIACLIVAGTGILWMLYLYAKYCLAAPVCLIEQQPARPALRRSRFLTKGSFKQIMLVYGLMVAAGMAFSMGLWLPSRIYNGFAAGKSSYIITLTLQSLGSFISGVLAGPIASIAVTLLYYDQRIRKEAFDLHWMMDSMAKENPSPQVEEPLSIA